MNMNTLQESQHVMARNNGIRCSEIGVVHENLFGRHELLARIGISLVSCNVLEGLLCMVLFVNTPDF